MEQFVFVTGMFRSGTTLLARMLNAHPTVAFASDPYSWIFKAFRNAVTQTADETAPFDDYYFHPQRLQMFEHIQRAPLTTPVGELDIELLRRRIADTARPFSPKLEPMLGRLDGRTFAELLTSGLRIVRDAYGDSSSRMVGVKETWTNEFAGHVLRAFPDAKVIGVIRDPRAVAGSKNVSDEKYPWWFLARQWRKLATCLWLVEHHMPEVADRFCLVRYEDLITSPEEQTARICRFLNIEPHADLIDPARYRDGAGQAWRQNSSYTEGAQGFDRQALDRWRGVLNDEQRRFIETLCWPEMQAFGYEPLDVDHFTPVFTSPTIAPDDLATWIRPYATPTEADTAMERERWRLLHDRGDRTTLDKQRCCLSEAFFEAARTICMEGRAAHGPA